MVWTDETTAKAKTKPQAAHRKYTNAPASTTAVTLDRKTEVFTRYTESDGPLTVRTGASRHRVTAKRRVR